MDKKEKRIRHDIEMVGIRKVADWLQKNGHADIALKVTSSSLDIINTQENTAA